jgi:anti-sigma regulatory factor (Ser/Thr protein kinase)
VLSLTVPATVTALGRVATYAAELAARAGFTEPDGYRLRLILEELVTNVATHGATGPAQSAIELAGMAAPGQVWLQVCDRERPFDSVRAALDDPDGRLGGYGQVLVRAAADELEYRWTSGGNVTTVLVRHRPRDDG